MHIRQLIPILITLHFVFPVRVMAQTAGSDSLWHRIEGVPSESRTMTIDHEDRVWVGSETGAWVLSDGEWTQYNTENSGLPSNNVYTVVIDSLGAVWFGTIQGAAKLDGEEWTIFTSENSGLAQNKVSMIIFDHTGGVWMCNEAWVSYYDHGYWDTYSFWDGPSYSITSIAVDRDNELWVGTDDEGLWNLHGRVWFQYIWILDQDARDIATLLTCDDGMMMGSFSGRLYEYDGESWSVVTELLLNDYLTQDNHGSIWGASDDNLIFVAESRYASIAPNSIPVGAPESKYTTLYRAIDFDSQDVMWLLTSNGLFTYAGSVLSRPYSDTDEPYVWNGDKVTISWVASKPCTLNITSNFNDQAVEIARGIDSTSGTYEFSFDISMLPYPYDDGEVYVRLGSEDAVVDGSSAGLLFCNPRFADFDVYQFDERQVYTHGVSCLIEDGDGTIWAGLGRLSSTSHECDGIWLFDGEGFSQIDMEAIDPQYADMDLRSVTGGTIDSDGDAWFGCTGGLLHHTGVSWEQFLYGEKVYQVVAGSEGSIWVLTGSGLYWIKSGEETPVAYPWSKAVDTSGTIAMSPGGDIFCLFICSYGIL